MPTTVINDAENTSQIGMVTDLFIFKDKDDNRFVIQGMGTIEGDDSGGNEIAVFASTMLAGVVGFTRTEEIKHIGKYEEGKTMLPHYPYGTIHSVIGSYDVLLIGGPKFDEYEVDRKAKLN